MFPDQTIETSVENTAQSDRSLGARASSEFHIHPSVLPYRLIAVNRSTLCPEWEFTTDTNMEL